MKPKLSRHGDYQKELNFEVFSMYRVYIVFSADLIMAMEGRFGPANNRARMADAVTRHSNGGYTHIFLTDEATEGTIAHEAWHAVQGMFEYVNIKLDDESVAYHIGYIVDEIHKFKRAVQSVTQNEV